MSFFTEGILQGEFRFIAPPYTTILTTSRRQKWLDVRDGIANAVWAAAFGGTYLALAVVGLWFVVGMVEAAVALVTP